MTKVSCDQFEPFQLPDVLCAGAQKVNPGGIDRAVSQQIGQLDNVPARPVKRGGEQVPQVVGKHF